MVGRSRAVPSIIKRESFVFPSYWFSFENDKYSHGYYHFCLGVGCNIRYPIQTRENPLVLNMHVNYQIVLKICTWHDSDTVVFSDLKKIIWQLSNMLWANEFSWNLVSCFSQGYAIWQQTLGSIVGPKVCIYYFGNMCSNGLQNTLSGWRNLCQSRTVWDVGNIHTWHLIAPFDLWHSVSDVIDICSSVGTMLSTAGS